MIRDQQIFGNDRPVAQLALQSPCRAVIEVWFAEEGLGYTNADVDARGLPSALTPIGSEPVVLRISANALAGDPFALADALAELAARAPIIAILDVKMVDALPPLLDVEPAEFVAWPCGKEAFMSAMQRVGSPSFRDRTATNPINPEMLRDEIERIAKALAALAEKANTDAPRMRSTRSRQDSARLVRDIIRRRRARAQFFPAELFADPAWDILLDLTAARLEGTKVSISSLCIAASVPTTTALRWIKGMTNADMLEREADPEDGRRSFVRIGDSAFFAMENYLSLVDEGVV